MTKKQEKIKEAYGQYWESCNIDENGWTSSVSYDFLHAIPCDGKEMHIVYKHPEWWYRPKSLNGLEDNNGWIAIESEADLPKEPCNCWVKTSFSNEIRQQWFNGFFNHYAEWGKVTHYQIIVKPKPPIY